MTDSAKLVFDTVQRMLASHWCELLLGVIALNNCAFLAAWALKRAMHGPRRIERPDETEEEVEQDE